ncbi:MAG TPA: threonine dehydratase [Bryobacteraceae bacterium]|nr:threonine dehydratase [Bryobacteraceae bacterium]
MVLPGLLELEAAAELVHRIIPPTPQIRWPLLCARTGAEVFVKHENHSPVGAFKIRGGIVYMDALRRREPGLRGVIAATRGNHGQSIACAAGGAGLRAVIVVPRGNSREKNAAMRALGAELIEHGSDFQEAYEYSARLAESLRLHFVRSFEPALVAGVAGYALELFRGVPDLHSVYVPIGMGSGICGTIAARDALGLKTEVVGVVAAGAPAYARSFAAGRPVSTATADTLADGIACRVPDPEALEIILRGAARIVTVTDEEISAAICHLFTDTHNLAEGAGAAALAALLQERSAMHGRRVAVILTGGNIDRDVFARVLLHGPVREMERGA